MIDEPIHDIAVQWQCQWLSHPAPSAGNHEDAAKERAELLMQQSIYEDRL